MKPKKYPLIFPKPSYTEPSMVRYGGRIVKFRVTIIEDKNKVLLLSITQANRNFTPDKL
jgi:hypothetical protein